MSEHEFQLEVVDRLARIETKVDDMRESFVAHVADDNRRFEFIGGTVRKLSIDSEVAKQVGRTEGRKTGAKWAAAITTAILAAAELARAWVR